MECGPSFINFSAVKLGAMLASLLPRFLCFLLILGCAASCSKGLEKMPLDDLVEAAAQGDRAAMAELEKRTMDQLNNLDEVLEGADITDPVAPDPSALQAATAAMHQRFLEGKGKLHGTDGFTKDAAEGLRLLTEAANAGSGEAAFGLGVAYRYGLEVEANLEAALEWYRKAVAAGFTDAAEELEQVERLLTED